MEENDGSFEEKLHNFEKLLRNHPDRNEVHFFLSRQVIEFRKTLTSIQSTEPEDGFLAIQAYVQELEWFEKAWKTFKVKHYSNACKYFDLCAQSSNTNAMLILAHIYGSESYQQKNMEKSLDLYNQASNLGDPIALRSLGILYYDGLEVQRDNETALNYFLQASKKSDAESMYYLGEMYSEGYVVKTDKERAKKYFEQSARNGYKKAILKIQSLVEEDPPATHEFEVKSAPVQFLPKNALGDGGMQQTRFQVSTRPVAETPRIKKPNKRKRNSSNSLFQIALFASALTAIGLLYFADSLPSLSRKGKTELIEKSMRTMENDSGMKFKPVKGPFGAIKMWCSLPDEIIKDQLYNRSSEAAIICNFGKARTIAELASAFAVLEKQKKGRTNIRFLTGGNFRILASWCNAKPSRRAALTHSKKDQQYVCGFKKLNKIKDVYYHFAKYHNSL